MAGQQLGQPGGEQRSQTKFIVFENFEKMNTQSVRQALSEKELAWLENLQPIAGNNLTVVPAPNAALLNIADPIVSLFYADIGGVDYMIAFTTLGGGWHLKLSDATTHQFAVNGTFSLAPDVTTWQASRILINDATAGYCTYDGTLFAKQGNVSPNIVLTAGGFGYTSTPSVTISGGSGSGATAVAVLANGSVVAVNMTNAGSGYAATDVLVVTFGSGAGSGATGHVTMSGAAISRISIATPGANLTPGNYTLTFTGGGGSGASGYATVTGFFQGSVTSVTLTNPGSGYTSPPAVTMTPSAGGTAATFTAILLGQTVASIVLDTAGSGYLAAPTVLIQGGGGSNATAHATISGGAVNALILDTVGAGYQTAPTVFITSGQGAAASAHVWPFIPAGTTLAVFQGRVWLNGLNTVSNQYNILQWTGTGASYNNVGYDDFLAQDASASLLLTDADLIHAITALRSLNNYLFVMGDQSVKQIGNISLNSSGTVTLFTILTLSSDQGTIYPKSCISYNRVFMFANTNGVYGVFGSSVQKLSGDMDGIWKLVDFTQVPQGAIADINAIHNAVFLIRYKDPLSTTRSIMLTFDGKKWFVTAQGDSLKSIATAASLSTGQNSLYGSSGTDLTKLFARVAAVNWKVQTSLTHHGNAVQGKAVVRAGFSYNQAFGSNSVIMTVDNENSSSANYSMGVTSGFSVTGGSNDAANQAIGGSGVYLGFTVTGTFAGFTMTNLLIEYQEKSLWKGA